MNLGEHNLVHNTWKKNSPEEQGNIIGGNSICMRRKCHNILVFLSRTELVNKTQRLSTAGSFLVPSPASIPALSSKAE